jgi:hypothetical protein
MPERKGDFFVARIGNSSFITQWLLPEIWKRMVGLRKGDVHML